MKIKVNLKNIKARYKYLYNEIDKDLTDVGFKTMLYLQGNWDNGKGGDGINMKDLTEKYANYKKKKGRDTIPDLLFSGNLRRSLSVFNVQKYKKKVTVNNANLPQLRGLVEDRNNIMKVTDKFNSLMNKYILQKMQTRS